MSERSTRGVIRAIAELRRGTPVVIKKGAAGVVVLATEFAEDGLQPLTDLGLNADLLAITGLRAAVLNIPPAGEGTVVIELSSHIDAATIRSLADPTSDLDHPVRGPFRVAQRDPGAATEALTLCKRARLLPAVVFAVVPEGEDLSLIHI